MVKRHPLSRSVFLFRRIFSGFQGFFWQFFRARLGLRMDLLVIFAEKLVIRFLKVLDFEETGWENSKKQLVKI